MGDWGAADCCGKVPAVPSCCRRDPRPPTLMVTVIVLPTNAKEVFLSPFYFLPNLKRFPITFAFSHLLSVTSGFHVPSLCPRWL